MLDPKDIAFTDTEGWGVLQEAIDAIPLGSSSVPGYRFHRLNVIANVMLPPEEYSWAVVHGDAVLYGMHVVFDEAASHLVIPCISYDILGLKAGEIGTVKDQMLELLPVLHELGKRWPSSTEVVGRTQSE